MKTWTDFCDEVDWKSFSDNITFMSFPPGFL